MKKKLITTQQHLQGHVVAYRNYLEYIFILFFIRFIFHMSSFYL